MNILLHVTTSRYLPEVVLFSINTNTKKLYVYPCVYVSRDVNLKPYSKCQNYMGVQVYAWSGSLCLESEEWSWLTVKSIYSQFKHRNK